jgi:hypothetical protein
VLRELGVDLLARVPEIADDRRSLARLKIDHRAATMIAFARQFVNAD